MSQPSGSGFLSSSTDLDSIFDLLGSATPAAPTGLLSNGVDLSQRYFPLSAGGIPVGSPVGIQAGGQDLTAIFGKAPSTGGLALFIANVAALGAPQCYPIYMNGVLQNVPDGVAYRTGVTLKQVANISGGGSNPPMSGTYLAWGAVDGTGNPLAIGNQPTAGTVTFNGVAVPNVSVLSPQQVATAGVTTVPAGLGLIIGIPPAVINTVIAINGTFASGPPQSMNVTLQAVAASVWAYTTDDALINGVTAVSNTASTMLTTTNVEFAGPIVSGVSLSFQLGIDSSRAWGAVQAMQVVSYTPITGNAFTISGNQINMNLPLTQGTFTGTAILADIYGNQLPGGPITVSSVLGAAAAFLCYPGASISGYAASLLPMKINGVLYTSYPAGQTFPTGSIVEMTSPTANNGASNQQALQMIFGLIALKYKGGTVLGTSNQPTTWTTSSPGTTFYDVATVTSSLADTGPPYYAGCFYATSVDTANVMTFTATTNETTPSNITATLDLRTPGYQYTFIDRADIGQSVASGITCIYPILNNPQGYSASHTAFNTNAIESWFWHGTATFNAGSIAMSINQQFVGTESPGPLTTVAYNSLNQLLDNAPSIHFPTGTPLISINNVGTPTSGPVIANNLTWVINSYYAGSDWLAGSVNCLDQATIDADNTTVSIPTIKSQVVSGVRQPGDGTTVNYSATGPGWPDQTFAFPNNNVGDGIWDGTLTTGQATYFGQGALFLNRKRVHVA